MVENFTFLNTRVLIADKDVQSGMRLQALLPAGARCVGVVSDYESAFKLIEQYQPQVVLLNMNMALVLVNNKFNGRFVLIAIADESKPEYLRLGIEIKARDLLIHPLQAAPLAEALQKALVAYEREKQMQPETAATPALPAKPGILVGVISSKGGLGQSTLVANLGLAMATHCKQSVLTVDAIPQLGILPLLLDVPAIHTLEDIMTREGQLGVDEMEQALLTHKSGLRLLAAPVNDPHIDAARFITVLLALKNRFQFIVIDLPHFQGDFSRSVLAKSDLALLQLSLNIPSIRNASLALNVLTDLGLSKEQIQIVSTDFQSSPDLTRKDVTAHLKHPITHHLPDGDTSVLTSVNTGEAIVLHQPQHAYSLAMQRIAKRLAEPESAATENDPGRSLQQKLQLKGWF